MAETGLSYNWQRDYDSLTGKYVESDPVGLGGGINTYSYARPGPLSYSDPTGLTPNPAEATCVDPAQPICWAGIAADLASWLFTGAAAGAGASALVTPGDTRAVTDPMLTAKGNVADSQIVNDYGKVASEAKRCGKEPPERCTWLRENAGKYRADQVKATQRGGDAGGQVRKSNAVSLDEYIDPKDLSESTSRLLIWQALNSYSLAGLVKLLEDPEVEVRTSAARQMHIRGGTVAWNAARKLCLSRRPRDKVMGLFILGQLGTPRLPYKQETLDLIHSMLSRRQPEIVMEQALYTVGHLRQGRPLEHPNLYRKIVDLRVARGSALGDAKAFALR
jgi:hypothetical protein